MIADQEAGFDKLAGLGKAGVGVVVDGGQGFAGADGVADAFVEFEADGVVDEIVFLPTAAFEDGEGNAEVAAVCGGDEAGSRAGDVKMIFGSR